MMTVNSVDLRSWGISLGLHILLLLIMIFWKAFPDLYPLSPILEITLIEPEIHRPIDRSFEATVPLQPRLENHATSFPERAQVPSAIQPSARSAASQHSSDRESGVERNAPSTPLPPRELRGGTNPVEFQDFGGGKQERSPASKSDEVTRRESRESGFSASAESSDNVSGAGSGTERQITSDPGKLSTTPRSSANIQWDGGLSRNRIAGILPSFPPGASRDATVSIRFRVRPDGSMFGMTVIQKGEAAYERAALDAMRSWKFNSLPASAQQMDQVGTATFTFKVR